VAGEGIIAKEKEQRGAIAPRPFAKDKFIYHPEEDYYECPAGEKVIRKRERVTTKKSYTRHEVVYLGQSCRGCQFQAECVQSKRGIRQITRYLEYDERREKMDEKLKTKEGKEIMKKRSVDVEPTFGHIKQRVLESKSLLLRGMQKAKGGFGLVCIAHNLQKIANYFRSAQNGKTLADLLEIQAKAA
jgi:hypothetical protein